MRYGLYVPNVGTFADPRRLVALAVTAEASGWDGFFIWDMLTPALAGQDQPPLAVDPWIVLAGISVATARIRLGPMVTPLARRRASKVARETVTLDHLSSGRLILGVGLGDSPVEEFADFGEDPHPVVRAGKLDEVIEVVLQLWSGNPVSVHGRHLTVNSPGFLPTPNQSPRIPVWGGGTWPRGGPTRRAARLDGMFPISSSPQGGGEDPDAYLQQGRMSPADFADLAAYMRQARDGGDFDLIYGAPLEPPTSEEVRDFADSGVTWWLEMALPSNGIEAAEARARRPPGPSRDPPEPNHRQGRTPRTGGDRTSV